MIGLPTITDYGRIHLNRLPNAIRQCGIERTRIYNPVGQIKTHDPDGMFVRKWVSELASASVGDTRLGNPWVDPSELVWTIKANRRSDQN